MAALAAVRPARLTAIKPTFMSLPFVELPLSEGRYIWQWRVDGALPNEEATFAAMTGSANPNARSGFRWVKPVQQLTESYPR